MSTIIKPRIVLEGLRCCLYWRDCLSCPYSKYHGKQCCQKLFHDAEVVMAAQQYDIQMMMRRLQQ